MIYGTLLSTIVNNNNNNSNNKINIKYNHKIPIELVDEITNNDTNDNISLISTLALYRGIIASIDMTFLLLSISSNNNNNKINDDDDVESTMLYQQIFPSIFQVGLKSANVNKRTYTFQTLDQLFKKLLQYIQTDTNIIKINYVIKPDLIESMVSIILENWDHPSKRVTLLMSP